MGTATLNSSTSALRSKCLDTVKVNNNLKNSQQQEWCVIKPFQLNYDSYPHPLPTPWYLVKNIDGTDMSDHDHEYILKVDAGTRVGERMVELYQALDTLTMSSTNAFSFKPHQYFAALISWGEPLVTSTNEKYLGQYFTGEVTVVENVQGLTILDYFFRAEKRGDYYAIKELFQHLLSMQQVLEQIGYMHGDLSARQIVVENASKVPKIVDFKSLRPGKSENDHALMNTFSSTINKMAAQGQSPVISDIVLLDKQIKL